MEKYYDGPVFNGTACGVDMQDKPIKFRYTGVCGIGGLEAYNSFKCLDHLQPGDTIDYDDWQNIVYAARLIAKHYGWFENLDPKSEKFCKPFVVWNSETEEYDKDERFYQMMDDIKNKK